MSEEHVRAVSVWGRELMPPDEVASERGIYGWICREAVPDEDEARALAAEQASGFEARVVAPEELKLTPVLMREESEVEANINGHEFPLTVECTARARDHAPYWRIEGATEDAA